MQIYANVREYFTIHSFMVILMSHFGAGGQGTGHHRATHLINSVSDTRTLVVKKIDLV